MTELRYQRCAEIVRASRRFPPPWTIEELNNPCFIVRDKNGRRSAFSAQTLDVDGPFAFNGDSLEFFARGARLLAVQR
jgi:hypothetical protein